MREALRCWSHGTVELRFAFPDGKPEIHAYAIDVNEPIAIFDLRDCYRKRKPLTGIGKKLARVVRGGK